MAYPGSSRTRELVALSLLSAAALAVNQIESLLPYPLPGIKLGLANAFALSAFSLFGVRAAAAVNLTRVLLSGLLFVGFGLAFLCSLFGVLAALVVLSLLRPLYPGSISAKGIAQAQAMAFNAAQLAVVSVAVSSLDLFLHYLPIMAVASLATGLATGTASELICLIARRNGLA